MFKTIYVLESSWDSDNPLEHSSVMPFVREFAMQRDIKAYYQVFTDRKSFCHWVAQFNKQDKASPLLYIASHGNKGSMSGLTSGLKRQTIVDTLRKAKNIHYVHFGSCLFGNKENLELILRKSKHIKWVAGYDKTVDWVDSTLFDMLLWSRISTRTDKNKNIKTHTIVEHIVNDQASGLVEELGFNFSYRYGSSIYPKL